MLAPFHGGGAAAHQQVLGTGSHAGGEAEHDRHNDVGGGYGGLKAALAGNQAAGLQHHLVQ